MGRAWALWALSSPPLSAAGGGRVCVCVRGECAWCVTWRVCGRERSIDQVWPRCCRRREMPAACAGPRSKYNNPESLAAAATRNYAYAYHVGGAAIGRAGECGQARGERYFRETEVSMVC